MARDRLPTGRTRVGSRSLESGEAVLGRATDGTGMAYAVAHPACRGLLVAAPSTPIPAPVSNTTSRQRPPAGHRANPTPKAQPRRYSDSDQARIMGKDEDLTAPTASPALPECPIARTMRKRRARARQRVTPKQVDAPNVQPHRSNSGAAALPNAPPLPPAAPDMGAQSGRAARQRAMPRIQRTPRPRRPAAEKHGVTPPKYGDRRTLEDAAQLLHLQGEAPVKSARASTTTKGPRRNSYTRKGTRVHRPQSTVSPPVTAKPPGCQPARRPKPAREERQGAWVAHPRTRQIPRSTHLLRRAIIAHRSGLRGHRSTDVKPEQQRPLGRGPPTLIAAASVAVDQDKRLVTAIRRILQARTQVLTTEPPL
ncbi:hypothetical protein WOLCODRAFT_147243 [Wolfiporia cocos MD-104 SS10]|uniref:Uncharacterized protein n=1 Tax=Wolfiporia cocos (strain MD-104) TaxID=742152 RepID=A0A2H3IT25_WOLCO|nr:hypothetical protein WOLCODRAFT_147243 [Wolfiporia cocos MD-104 SS10]